MLYIDKDSIEMKAAVQQHMDYFRCKVNKMLTDIDCNPFCSVCTSTKKYKFRSVNKVASEIKKNLQSGNNLNDIITGYPQNLKIISEAFYSTVLDPIEYAKVPSYLKGSKKVKNSKNYKVIHLLVKDIMKLFDYKSFVASKYKTTLGAYSAYHMAQNLNRRSCTYCNRMYTTTMVVSGKEKVMRPQFDHWYPKSKYPLLAVSFFNLIPSCNVCNSSVKGGIELELRVHTHPYMESTQTDEFFFDYDYDTSIDKYRIYVKSTNASINRAKTTVEKLKIDKMYDTHHEELKDLIKIKESYTEDYINEIRGLFPNNALTKKDVYLLLFGTEYDMVDFHKRPLSKFKSDILKKLEIIT